MATASSRTLPGMPRAHTATGIELEYDTFGSPDDPAVLLVMGLTAQMIAWQPAFCQGIAETGRYVIRFDNRDCGLSTKIEGSPVDMNDIFAAMLANDPESIRKKVPYTLSDMSDDAFHLLDEMQIQRAHIVGASMGGMIVQTMAIEHPERVLSLTSIMSTTGEIDYGQSSPEAQVALLSPAPTDRDAYIAAAPRTSVWMSNRYFDAEQVKAQAAESFDRSFYPAGAPRQLGAIIASGSRADGLRGVRVPTLVIHGLDDQLIGVSGGERTAQLVAGAMLMKVEDMGHDLPVPLWPEIIEAIRTHTAGIAAGR